MAHDNPREIQRLRSLRATLDEIDVQAGGLSNGQDEMAAGYRVTIASIEADWSDERLLGAYRQTSREPGQLEGDTL